VYKTALVYIDNCDHGEPLHGRCFVRPIAALGCRVGTGGRVNRVLFESLRAMHVRARDRAHNRQHDDEKTTFDAVAVAVRWRCCCSCWEARAGRNVARAPHGHAATEANRASANIGARPRSFRLSLR
jgi:hypothetical protein